VADKLRYRCIICGTEAFDRPPRHCPTCGAPASRWRLVVDRPVYVPEKAPEKPADKPPEKTPDKTQPEVTA
jgi:hypothetical protein